MNKLETALDIFRTFEKPINYFLYHFSIKKFDKLRLKNGLVFYAPDISSFYTIVSCLEEYNISKIKIAHKPIIIDIGACIGAFAIQIANKFKDSKIYAYEPNKRIFQYLNKNIKENGFQDRIKAFNVAISDKKGKANFNIYRTLESSLENLGKQPKEIQEINTITLRDILEQNGLKHIDFLKMDCEGAEYDILLSTSKKTLKRIKNIVLEYHNFKGHEPEEIICKLKDGGFLVKITGKLKKGPNERGIIHARRE